MWMGPLLPVRPTVVVVAADPAGSSLDKEPPRSIYHIALNALATGVYNRTKSSGT